MVAITIMTGTKDACNHDNNGDLICLQSRLERGLNMHAISSLNRTIYAWNLFQKGSNMLASIENLFSRNSSKNYSHVILGSFSTLQSCLVLFEKDCKHK